MYTKYFGFNEKPFTLTPNPRFIFLSKNHKEAFAHLLYGINYHYGFIELTGEVGTGKTTVLRTLLGQLQDDSYRTALIFSPCLTGVELLRSINAEFGLDSKSEYANELLTELNRFLLAETATGRTVVLVIDEAQNLEPDVLEQIRLISNLETENDKLIQIVLAGQPELEALLARSDLRQLSQRIAVRYKLHSLGMSETRFYIRQRMEVAGDSGGVSFSNLAIIGIFLCTRGVPRMVNILCDRALLIAYGDEHRRITASIVMRAMWELLNISLGRRLSQFFSGIFAAVFMNIRSRIKIIIALMIVFVSGGYGYLVKQKAHLPESKAKLSPPAIVSVAADKTMVPSANVIQRPLLAARKNPNTTLPSFIPLAGLDRTFSSQKPGWERYVGADAEFRLSRAAGKIKAVQVLAAKGHMLSESKLKTILVELTGTDVYKITSHEQKTGFTATRATLGSKADLLIYRKKSALQAFVVSLN